MIDEFKNLDLSSKTFGQFVEFFSPEELSQIKNISITS
jgi:hypothetical protein